MNLVGFIHWITITKTYLSRKKSKSKNKYKKSIILKQFQ